MKRNEIKQKYHKETLNYYKDKNGLINKEYMNWLEDNLIKEVNIKTDTSESKVFDYNNLIFVTDAYGRPYKK